MDLQLHHMGSGGISGTLPVDVDLLDHGVRQYVLGLLGLHKINYDYSGPDPMVHYKKQGYGVDQTRF